MKNEIKFYREMVKKSFLLKSKLDITFCSFFMTLFPMLGVQHTVITCFRVLKCFHFCISFQINVCRHINSLQKSPKGTKVYTHACKIQKSAKDI